MSLYTYLHFDDNCREAFDFYRSGFGGEFESIQTYRENPDLKKTVAEDELDTVMHISLPIGSSVLTGRNIPRVMGPAPVTGSNFSILHVADSREDLEEIFPKLSAGGQVTVPVEYMFWGGYYASCTDKFGVAWQLMCWQAQNED